MISNPNFGWCDFSLGDFTGTPSYLTDVPIDLLDAFCECFEKGRSVCFFDEEGTEFWLILDMHLPSIFVIEEKVGTVLHDFSSMDIMELAKELIANIEKDLEGWGRFLLDKEDAPKIKESLEKLEKLIYKIEN